MGIRTTSGAVAGIIEVDAAISVTPFIEVASALVDELSAADSTVTATRLELVERWLAAHFYAVRDPRSTSEQAEGIGASYESRVDLGLSITRYGQQAMMLDTTGWLAAYNAQAKDGAPRKAKLRWLGTPREESDS